MAAVTALFRDIAVAVEENESFLRDNFGAASIIEVVMGLQVGCIAGLYVVTARGQAPAPLALLANSSIRMRACVS